MIPPGLQEFMTLDLMPLVAVTASAATLALLGSFLVLRRQAMLGDAMAHSVLPGLVVAFLVTGSRSAGPMFLGASAAAALTGLTIAAIIRHGRVERSAAIGLVYTTMFALGVLLLEVNGGSNVDLDVDCVLSGQLELMFWNAPASWSEVLGGPSLAGIPPAAAPAGPPPGRLHRHRPRLAAPPGGDLRRSLRSLARPLSHSGLGGPHGPHDPGHRAQLRRRGLGPRHRSADVPSGRGAAARADRMRPFVLLSVGLGAAAGLVGYGMATRVAPSCWVPRWTRAERWPRCQARLALAAACSVRDRSPRGPSGPDP